ncbi:MAG: hypothetical protein ACLT63_00605 [Bacteroides xylanisolvens]
MEPHAQIRFMGLLTPNVSDRPVHFNEQYELAISESKKMNSKLKTISGNGAYQC